MFWLLSDQRQVALIDAFTPVSNEQGACELFGRGVQPVQAVKIRNGQEMVLGPTDGCLVVQWL